MNMSMFLGISAPWKKPELYELWCRFREDPHAVKILSDFMNSDSKTARALIEEFEATRKNRLAGLE